MQLGVQEAEWASVGSWVPRGKEELKSTVGGDLGPVESSTDGFAFQSH